MKFIRTTILILLAACAHALAEDFNVNTFLAEMEKAENSVKNVKFDFNQEIAFTLSGEKQFSSGQVAFMKPAGIWIKQSKPIEQTIISDGKKVWIYTPEYNQVISDDWKKWSKNSMIPDSLLNVNQDLKSYKGKYVFSNGGLDGDKRLLLLTPVKKEAWTIKFWINTKDYSITKLVLSGENLSVTTVISNYKANTDMDKNLFRFNPPKGVEIMRME